MIEIIKSEIASQLFEISAQVELATGSIEGFLVVALFFVFRYSLIAFAWNTFCEEFGKQKFKIELFPISKLKNIFEFVKNYGKDIEGFYIKSILNIYM